MARGLTMTMADVRKHQERHGFAPVHYATSEVGKYDPSYDLLQPKLKRQRGMNKTEEGYSRILESQKQRGAIVEWAFEPFSLRYGDNAYYKPDFAVNLNRAIKLSEVISLIKMSPVEMQPEHVDLLGILQHGDSIEIHEIKGGRIYPEAKPRFKAAKLCHQKWATFVMMQKTQGTWRQIL